MVIVSTPSHDGGTFDMIMKDTGLWEEEEEEEELEEIEP